MDATAIGISGGLACAVAYTVIRAIRQTSFDIGTVLLVFLAGFAIPGGGQLIRAALAGDPDALPQSWREYVAVAGIAAIGLSLHYLVQSHRNAWARRATVVRDEGVTSSSTDEPAV